MEQQCPICQMNNNCQIDDKTKDCWCTTYKFTDELNEHLKSLPLQCICSSCAEKFGAIKMNEQKA